MYGNSGLSHLEFPRLRPLCRPRPWRGLLFVGFAYLVFSGKARQPRRAARDIAEKFDSCRVSERKRGLASAEPVSVLSLLKRRVCRNDPVRSGARSLFFAGHLLEQLREPYERKEDSCTVSMFHWATVFRRIYVIHVTRNVATIECRNRLPAKLQAVNRAASIFVIQNFGISISVKCVLHCDWLAGAQLSREVGSGSILLDAPDTVRIHVSRKRRLRG